MTATATAAARLMAANDGPRIAAMAFDGWDTHANQGGATGQLANRLAALDKTLEILETGLGAVWSKTTVAIVTEFGRTAHVNGSDGSDHGTATAAFLVGGAVKGGRVVADWPGLKDAALYEGRDLKPTLDLRAVMKGVLMDGFGLSETRLANAVFPDTSKQRAMRGLLV